MLWDFFLLLSLCTGVKVYGQEAPANEYFLFFLCQVFLFNLPTRAFCQGSVFSCVWRVWGTVCSAKHLQTIIGKCVKAAINLLYWYGSLSGSPRRTDFFPMWASDWKGRVRGRSQERKVTRGNRGAETEPAVLRQSLRWKQNLLEMFKRRAGYHRSSSKKRNFQGLRQGWVETRDEGICVSKEPQLDGMVPVKQFRFYKSFLPPLQHSV